MNNLFKTIFVCVVVVSGVVVGYAAYSNRQMIILMQDDGEVQTNQITNTMHAVNYNTKILFDQNSYIHEVSEEGEFQEMQEVQDTQRTLQHNLHKYDMMKNYDALNHLI
jgi:archaellum component FlaG (FlaF/FlaG flagellin family)